ncbi:sensor histidine kinase [Rhodospira trueperi]|uniref:histidine kinase n=1 Tax=Rhodospira trueperi TaxID=69960 RepID=A0A1G7AP40_9PROT|nr:HAMP domain-containing sensor histidine kinase [Rhodospira trueperi]SDE15765.1 Signal transduction histidine kinase [Rhodospira trueperi]
MLPGNVFSGAPFKTALWILAAACLALTVTGAAVFGIVRSTLYEQLGAQILDDTMLLRDIYQTGGPAALTEAVKQFEQSAAPVGEAIGVFALTGERLSGNILKMPEIVGWGPLFPRPHGLDPSAAFYGNVSVLGDRVLVVGRDLGLVRTVQTRLLRALVGAGAAVALLSLLIGYGASRGVYRRLAEMAAALEEVSKGRTEVRLPMTAGNDQIDRISRQINGHLDHLATLIDSTRHSMAAIAHELKTPLNHAHVLLQNAALATNGHTDPDALEHARQEVSKISGIFDTVLRISRLDAGADQTNLAPVSVADIMQDIAAIYAPVLEASDQSLHCDLDGARDARILGDVRMLRQMLANLVENASRHCPAGTSVFLRVLACESGMVRLEVADTGPGIPPEARTEALKPFVRVRRHLGPEGTGLGLALVAAIVARHGGTIALSDNAPGLIVRMSFPACDV